MDTLYFDTTRCKRVDTSVAGLYNDAYKTAAGCELIVDTVMKKISTAILIQAGFDQRENTGRSGAIYTDVSNSLSRCDEHYRHLE